MKGLAVPVFLSLILGAQVACASPLGCTLDREKTDNSACKKYIGKRLWVSIPAGNPNSVEVTFKKDDWSNTLKLKSGASFLVTGIEKGQIGVYDYYAVRLDDGRPGWVSISGVFLYDFDPAAKAKADAAECDRRGPPKIGMTTAELIETCWRKPRRIVKKTTAAGVEENYIYGLRHIVKIVDGKVTEIVEAR